MRTGAGKSRIKNEKSNWIDEKIVPVNDRNYYFRRVVRNRNQIEV